MKELVKVWEEEVSIPTYEAGEPDKNPMFLEKRVYQGSSGKVYPYPMIESISDTRIDKTYKAVFMENKYLKIMVLPELGGRIQRAYDKTNNYDFVYYNKVIKPALVGLVGPWISGGIEFNWPQHHRPTTFMSVDYVIQENDDNSKTVFVNDVDQMYGTKGIAGFTLYPDKAYIEITGQLYNRTSTPQTFLWWANPAIAANNHTQSIFPPDVHAVMDHGKRDVSKFPIATGEYYKHDYSAGVDISRYKNIPVPTSYMAEKSEFDFVGGYDHGLEAGILHVADHHISPGKKQWTWGCGDFGKAWDRNLTDDDGPYIELMTGVYTDNQPDFTWLKPFEEKTFKQYFMPYKSLGAVKNATIHAAVNLEVEENEVAIGVYATSNYEDARIQLYNKDCLCLEDKVSISPINVYKQKIRVDFERETDLKIVVYCGTEILVEYAPLEKKIEEIPEPAKPAIEPKDIKTNEELYLTGQHIEQYRHATYDPDSYYLEGLKRDEGDIRINNAYGLLLLKRGLFAEAEKYFRKAIERLTWKNPNPYNSEPYYNLGLSLFYQKKNEEAFDSFFKATWTSEQQEMSYYFLGVLEVKKKNYSQALEYINKSLVKNSHNIKARGIKAVILRKLGKKDEALKFIDESIKIDRFDYMSLFEKVMSDREHKEQILEELNRLMRNFHENYLQTAKDYAEADLFTEAIFVLGQCSEKKPMLKYYKGYYYGQLNIEDKALVALKQAGTYSPCYCFPNKLEDIIVLNYAIATNPSDAKAHYYLGNLWYDKRQYEQATKLWETSAKLDSEFPTVFRNLALSYYNKMGKKEKAKVVLETAFNLNKEDARVLLELDQLYKKMGVSKKERFEHLKKYEDTISKRDDLYIEFLTLLNLAGEHKTAYSLMMNRKFHPWEGGEGKITTQYTTALVEIAKEEIINGHLELSKVYLEKALYYPENLSEGKLEGTKDNHIYYYLGLVNEKLGEKEEAKKNYERASLGDTTPAGMMYYNDQPADMILYQGMAMQKLGKEIEAKSRFYKLIDYGEQHMFDKVRIEYFAVSLPDFLIFDEDLEMRNKVHCYYLIGLGNAGLGNAVEAKEALNQALSLDQNHMGCIMELKKLSFDYDFSK